MNYRPPSGGRFYFGVPTEHVFRGVRFGVPAEHQSIIGSGNAMLIEDSGERISALTTIMEHCGYTSLSDFPESALDKAAVIRLDVVKWSCKQHI